MGTRGGEVKEGHLQVEPLQRGRQAGRHIAELVAGETEGDDCLGAVEGVGGQARVAQLVVVEVHGPEGSQAPATSPALASPPPRTPAQGHLQCESVCVRARACVCVCVYVCVCVLSASVLSSPNRASRALSPHQTPPGWGVTPGISETLGAWAGPGAT